jgi:hypothetical protein
MVSVLPAVSVHEREEGAMKEPTLEEALDSFNRKWNTEPPVDSNYDYEWARWKVIRSHISHIKRREAMEQKEATARETQAIVPTEGARLIGAGASITRIENETMAQISITRPRDVVGSMERALKELEIAPKLAENHWYRIPYKDYNFSPPKVTWGEGLSIVAARNLARCWGNFSASQRFVEDTGDAVLVEGVFIDYETGSRFSQIKAVSRWYKRKSGAEKGKMIKHSEDRFPQILGAAASKVERNAILSGLPESYKLRYADTVIALIKQAEKGAGPEKLTPKQVANRIVKAFKPYGVGREQLELLAEAKLEELSDDKIAELRGVLNGIEHKETTVEEVFGGATPETEGAEAGPGEKSAPGAAPGQEQPFLTTPPDKS